MLASVSSRWKFNLFMLTKLPAAYISGVRLAHIDPERCDTTVPYKWLSQNPFRSTYFACLAMAAEMSTGVLALLAIEGSKPGISMLVVGLEAEFSKKATDVTTFSCDEGKAIFDAVEAARNSADGIALTTTSIGRNGNGEEVARFRIRWSFRQRSN